MVSHKIMYHVPFSTCFGTNIYDMLSSRKCTFWRQFMFTFNARNQIKQLCTPESHCAHEICLNILAEKLVLADFKNRAGAYRCTEVTNERISIASSDMK